MKVLITGAEGFIGKNLRLHLAAHKDVEIVCFTRANSNTQLASMLVDVDAVFHLAGVNRPQDPADFTSGNVDLTQALCGAIEATGKKIPVVYTSSTQAELDNPYGVSKRAAEDVLFGLQRRTGSPVHVFRLPNVFGKWCRPNYNSAVATFCHNISRGLPIKVNDPAAPLTLVYVDDVIECFLAIINGRDINPADMGAKGHAQFQRVQPQYQTTVGQLAQQIQLFKDSRTSLTTERVGGGLTRALYATYVSYLPTNEFAYDLPVHADPRGRFVEMLKTPDCGQFSYFTAHRGITRGGHYHHTKSEKFLVIKGLARFKFRHMQTGEIYELTTAGDKPQVVETVPGWTHDITNIGDDEMVVMLWANEIFDRKKPDTYSCPL